MGSYVSSIIKRLFYFPLQRKPICYFRQEDFSSTGAPLLQSKLKRKRTEKKQEMDDFQSKFYSSLLKERRMVHNQKGRSSSVIMCTKDYPGWDETTVSNIHSLFLLFNNRENGMLNFINFAAILESLGDTNTHEQMRKHFDIADADKDGWINYDEFIKLMYNMNPIDPETEEITGVARLCKETADNIKFVTALRVGEQLEYGLF